MSKAQRDKGARFEREIVARFKDSGFPAQRVPLSGAAGGRYSGDVSVTIDGQERLVECKKRGSGFKFLYQHLDGAEILVVGADRQEPLAVMPLESLMAWLKMAERSLEYTRPTTSNYGNEDLQDCEDLANMARKLLGPCPDCGREPPPGYDMIWRGFCEAGGADWERQCPGVRKRMGWDDNQGSVAD